MKLKIQFERSSFLYAIIKLTFFVLALFLLTLSIGGYNFFGKSNLDENNTTQNDLVRDASIQSARVAANQVPFASLAIPNIDVDASIISLGLTSLGAMDTPKNSTDVAWFNLGPRPGETGSAVIAGHFGWKDGQSAVFDNLYKVREGDKLYVKDGEGAVITFVVRELRIFGEGQDATEIFSSNDGRAHLNLITCQGIWNKDKKSYSERLVVFTDKE